MKFSCPVCAWSNLDEDPSQPTYEICEQCGVEFGYEAPELYLRIRAAWIAAGRPFWFTSSEWNAQLNECRY